MVVAGFGGVRAVIRVMFGFLVIAASMALGVYLGIAWCFVGGAEQLFAARLAPDIVLPVIRILFSATALFGTVVIGLLIGCPLIVPKEVM